ncbi:MAG TPA: hypothetical protein PKL98_01570 [Candidatus Pacearchaeota archaeon]|nr:hypothetical protein [Candidatus Pacearchaeota archaeon]HPM08238.1 hypothetical protein [Candidatus Pacearchaeota archaeon]HQI74442.1 hypothetical protein [Candidatus Pacearchaeota archaeon]
MLILNKILINYRNYKNLIVLEELVQIIRENGPYPGNYDIMPGFFDRCPEEIKEKIRNIEIFANTCENTMAYHDRIEKKVIFNFKKAWEFAVDKIDLAEEYYLKSLDSDQWHEAYNDYYYYLLYIHCRAIDNAFLIYCNKKRIKMLRPEPISSY